MMAACLLAWDWLVSGLYLYGIVIGRMDGRTDEMKGMGNYDRCIGMMNEWIYGYMDG